MGTVNVTELQSKEVQELFNRHWNDYGKLGVYYSLKMLLEFYQNKLIEENQFLDKERVENQEILEKLIINL
jgi:hypothetical protein